MKKQKSVLKLVKNSSIGDAIGDVIQLNFPLFLKGWRDIYPFSKLNHWPSPPLHDKISMLFMVGQTPGSAPVGLLLTGGDAMTTVELLGILIGITSLALTIYFGMRRWEKSLGSYRLLRDFILGYSLTNGRLRLASIIIQHWRLRVKRGRLYSFLHCFRYYLIRTLVSYCSVFNMILRLGTDYIYYYEGIRNVSSVNPTLLLPIKRFLSQPLSVIWSAHSKEQEQQYVPISCRLTMSN